MNYNFYQKCTDMRYYNNGMYISNVRSIIRVIYKISKYQQQSTKLIELEEILNYYEL
jgi:hypothetical protein